jgi:outer membrane protein
MRSISINIALLSVFMIAVTGSLSAQTQKIGFIDSDLIMQSMPEYSGIEQRLTLISENWRREMEEMEREIEERERDFEAREILFTDEIRQQRIDEINLMRDQLDRYIQDKFGPQGEYFTRQKELLEPIQRQIFDAVNSVANRDGFDFIFDRSQDTRFLFARQEWNLTEEVMLNLGIDTTGN